MDIKKEFKNFYIEANTKIPTQKEIDKADKFARSQFEKYGRYSKEYKKATDKMMNLVMKRIEAPDSLKEEQLEEMSKEEAPKILKKMLTDLKVDIGAFGKNKVFQNLENLVGSELKNTIKAGIKYQVALQKLVDNI